MIVRADNSGLGNQTYELAQMLKPDLVMVIDFSDHNGFKQYPERYANFNCMFVKGFPNKEDIVEFSSHVDTIFSCETFYNDFAPRLAKRVNGTKSILQYNYELFGGHNNKSYIVPNLLVAPSVWNIDQMKRQYNGRVFYLPPPTNQETFAASREINKERHGRLLHIAGKPAKADRNGTNSVLEMLRYSEADYELVIRVQTDADIECDDPRVTIEYGDIDNRADMYSGFDAMVLPRRYAGLCLPMNEALLSGLPVFMTDVSPNNFILPREWLATATSLGTIRTKTNIESFNANPKKLARLIDNYFDNTKMLEQKDRAYEIGYQNFSPDVLRKQYKDVLGI